MAITGADYIRRAIGADPAVKSEIILFNLCASIAEELHEARTQRHLTQKRLAKLAGTSQSAVARFESGDFVSCSLRSIAKISAALDLRVELKFAPWVTPSTMQSDYRFVVQSAIDPEVAIKPSVERDSFICQVSATGKQESRGKPYGYSKANDHAIIPSTERAIA